MDGEASNRFELLASNRFVPSLLEAIADQNPPTPTVTDLSVHEPPESAEVQMWLGTSGFP